MAIEPTSTMIQALGRPSLRTTPATSPQTHASTSWTGAPGEFRPPRYASPQPLLANGEPFPTVGPLQGQWIQRSLVHGEGDAFGQRVRLLIFQWFILSRIYEYDPDTARLAHDRVLIVMPKGNSKTELCGDIGDAELMGPAAPLRAPKVTISAASWKQADELLDAATLAITGSEESPGPLAGQFQRGLHLLDDRILVPDARGGRLVRIAAVGSTADGGKETCHIGDEIHEWKGERRERVYTVKGKSLRKRLVPRGTCATCRHELVRAGAGAIHRDPTLERDHLARPITGSIQIGITTAGDDPTVVTDNPTTLLAKLYRHGVAVAEGRTLDPGFLFLCWEADPKLDLEKSDELRQAILQSNPAAGDFLDIQGKIESIQDPTVPRHEALRYDLGIWSPAPDSWLDLKTWMGRAHPTLRTPPKGTPIALGFDGSKSRDSTALWGATLGPVPHLFALKAWDRPKNAPQGWTVPKDEVDHEVRDAFEFFDVKVMQVDPPRWEREIEDWEKAWPGRIIRFETDVYQRFGPAVGRLHDAVMATTPTVTHDGDPGLTQHIANARTHETRWGMVIQKEQKDSPRRIDRAVAAVLAHDGASSPAAKPVNRGLSTWN